MGNNAMQGCLVEFLKNEPINCEYETWTVIYICGIA